MTDKVSAARCRLYQLFPHCVWLLRRRAAQRCPQGLERRRTGRRAWRDKNLISSQPLVASPSIPPSSNPRRTTVWYSRYTHMRSFLLSLQCVWCWKDWKGWQLYFCFTSCRSLLSWSYAASQRPHSGYFHYLGFRLNWDQASTSFSHITWC